MPRKPSPPAGMIAPQSITWEPRLQHDSWQGTLWLAPDFAILHGAAGATDSHAHYAHQLMLSTGAPFTAELDGIVHTARHLLIESLRPHAIVAAPAFMLTIYAEPQRLSSAALLAAANSAGAPKLDSLAAALQAQPREQLADARVQRALDQVDALLSGKVSAAAVAEGGDCVERFGLQWSASRCSTRTAGTWASSAPARCAAWPRRRASG